ncbi:hypothetical protein GH714_029308 [Hevea brasiliensis]|uniref:non-specific serine/threonine protein kinase n=1 Tax=Hevea brasiliensis TaxID=3981 RepID=A0A6A6M6A8_HEVBR|nr:hypothetical protein GH714_029308 [Hevea brasiliensis]
MDEKKQLVEEEDRSSESGDYTSETKEQRITGAAATTRCEYVTLLRTAVTLSRRYVALKVQKSAQHYTEAAMDEITILQQIAEGDPDDKKCVYSDYRGMPIHKVKEICVHILVGLDYLHRQLSIIHTDLKPENILLLSMIDPSKDPRKSGAPLILPNSKDKTVVESAIGKINGDLTRNQKKKIRRKAKRAAQGCVEKEVSAEADADPEKYAKEESSANAKTNVGSAEDRPTSSDNINSGSDADGTKSNDLENQGNKGKPLHKEETAGLS